MFLKFYNAHTDANGVMQPSTTQNPTPDDQIKQIKEAATKTTEDIALSAFDPSLNLGNAAQGLPLGDNPPRDDGVIKTTVHSNDIIKNLDELDRDVAAAKLEGGKSDESIRSFEGLKGKYKNGTSKIREQVNSLHTQVVALTNQLQGQEQLLDKAKKFDELQPTVTQLEAELENLKKENDSLTYYRRKYDLESDPIVKKEFSDPMRDLKTKSMDILTNNDLDEAFWNELISSDSEFKINTLIDNHRISNLNAQSLKRYVNNYQHLKREYDKISTPENIEAAIDTATGRRLQQSQQVSEQVFDATQTKFKDWVSEIVESNFNKEHNHFIYEPVMAEAKKNYAVLKQMLPKDITNQSAFHAMSKAALMAAAYPIQTKMVKHLLEIVADQQETINNSKAPSMRQTKEHGFQPQAGSIDELKKESAKTIDQIAQESWSSQVR